MTLIKNRLTRRIKTIYQILWGFFINKIRASSNLSRINLLAHDVELFTSELYSPNAFYGHSAIIKKYADLPSSIPLKCLIEHGIYFGGYLWEGEINFKLPSILTFSKYRQEYLKKATDKEVYAIGPLIAYSDYSMSIERRLREKKRLGNNLLVFPAHSTHHNLCHFNIEEHCSRIKELGKPFDSIRICLYWKDILRGFQNIYKKFGFECITAGHIYDPLFLPRLKSIIDISDFTFSNQLGTHIGYSVFLGKPHYMEKEIVNYQGKKGIPNPADDFYNINIHPDIYEVQEAFNEFRYDISKKQKDIINKYWGINELKSPDEMRSILNLTEETYTSYSR